MSWRVVTSRGNYRVVHKLDLLAGDQVDQLGLFRSEIVEWGSWHWRELLEMYEAAYGQPAPPFVIPGDSWIADQVEEAFRTGRLVLVLEEPARRQQGGGGGGSSPAPPPPQQRTREDSAGDESQSSGSSGAAAAPKKQEKTWFRAALKDEDGEPMANEDYILVDTDGVQRKGKLDGNGEVYIPPILPPGKCTISFPNIHLNPRKKKK